jgi:hypothetical protein
MWLPSSDIMSPEIAREVSGRAEAPPRRKPGVFELATRVQTFGLVVCRRGVSVGACKPRR